MSEVPLYCNPENLHVTGDWDEEGFSEISLENKEGQKLLTFWGLTNPWR